MLKTYCHDNQKDWDSCLPYVMMAYRTAIHETTGYTPSEMMMGREAILPADLLFEKPRQDFPENQTEYVTNLQESLERVYKYAREHLEISSDRKKRNYDHKAEGGGYKKGDAVWLYNPKPRRALCPKFPLPRDGRYVVTKRLSDVTYRIQKGSRRKVRVVHCNRLKPYNGENAPTWFRDMTEEVPMLATPEVKIDKSDENQEQGNSGTETSKLTRDEVLVADNIAEHEVSQEETQSVKGGDKSKEGQEVKQGTRSRREIRRPTRYRD